MIKVSGGVQATPDYPSNAYLNVETDVFYVRAYTHISPQCPIVLVRAGSAVALMQFSSRDALEEWDGSTTWQIIKEVTL